MDKAYSTWSIFAAVAVLASGVLLACSQVEAPKIVDSGLPDSHWAAPVATSGAAPHDWSALEKSLQPEACAQCHAEQFGDWKKSLHAAAYSPGLIGQFSGMGHADGNDCLKCHAPLAEQKYVSNRDMLDSLKIKLKHPVGFSEDGEFNDHQRPLRHAGVTCAACHVRGWQRFGPPQRGSGAVGKVEGAAHGGFTATKDFERSNFCASCHQFPDEYAINGKPLENTVQEWQTSRFAREGVQCQNCHMPDRKHLFRGIHDPEMTRKGLAFELESSGMEAALTVTSKWIGHAFPTYVTPKVVVRVEALDSDNRVLRKWQWEIIREVYYDEQWKEKRDTRLMPGESRKFAVQDFPQGSVHVRFVVEVIPDHFYKEVYAGLLSDVLDDDAEELVRQAAKHADANDYTLYDEVVAL